jgi:hypothetical protein
MLPSRPWTVPAGTFPRPVDPEARAYEVLREILLDLMQVERTLPMVQGAMPDDEREKNLAAIRVAREALQQFL